MGRDFARRMMLLVVVLLSDGCGGAVAPGANAVAATGPATAPANTIVIDNFTFTPATLTVTAGTAVTWVNKDDVPHTATSSAKPRVFDSGTLDTDGKYSFTFQKPGTYPYFCAVHTHMTSVIIVK